MSIKSTSARYGVTAAQKSTRTSGATTEPHPFRDDGTHPTTAHTESPAIRNPFEAQLHAFALREEQFKSEIAALESLAGP